MESHDNVNRCQDCNSEVVDAEANTELAKMKVTAIKIKKALDAELKLQATEAPARDQMTAMLAKFRDDVKILNTTNEQATLLNLNSTLFENAPNGGKDPINVCKCQSCGENLKKSENMAELLTHSVDYLSALQELITTTVRQIEEIAIKYKAEADAACSEIDPEFEFDVQGALDDYEKSLEKREAAVSQREIAIEAQIQEMVGTKNLQHESPKVQKVGQLPKDVLKKLEGQKQKAEKLELIEKRLDDETSEKKMEQKKIRGIENSFKKVTNEIGKVEGKSAAEARNELKISNRILDIISIGLKNENKNPPNIDFVQGQLFPSSELCAAYPASAVLDLKAVFGGLVYSLRKEVASSNEE